MKHIRLYENFSDSKEVIFDWMPYDKEENNPIQAQMPQSLSINELESFAASATPEMQAAGLYIAHVPTADKGFERYITTSFSPLQFNFTTWDSNFQKKSEIENLDAGQVISGEVAKGAKLISRFTDF